MPQRNNGVALAVRGIIVTAGLGLMLVVGALALAPRLVAWDDYREELTTRVAALTGKTVTLGGRIDLRLLPRPTLSLARTTLASPEGYPIAMLLEVDRVDLQLEPLPLLRGDLAVQEVRLVRPVLRLDRPPTTAPGVLGLAGLGTLTPMAMGGPSRLSVVDGRAMIEDDPAAPAVDSINFELAARSQSGPFLATGRFDIASSRFAFDLRLGQVSDHDSTTLQLELTTQPLDGEPVTLRFRGLFWPGQDAPRLRGELVARGADLRAGMEALEAAFGSALPALPESSAQPFEVSGRLALDRARLEVTDLRLRFAETEARGQMTITVASPPRLELALELPKVALADDAPLAAFAAIPAALISGPATGRIDLKVGTLDYRGDSVRRLRATLVLEAPGRMRIEQARAVLPGQADLGFTGGVVADAAGMTLHGALTLATDDLGRGLAWLGLDPEVPAGRLRTMSLASQLLLNQEGLRLDQVDLRVDASRLTGSFGAQWGERPQVAAAVVVDRLDLDAYRSKGAPGDPWLPLANALKRLDLALDARVDRLIWQGIRFQEVKALGRSIGARLTVDQLAFRTAETGAELAGFFDLGESAFELQVAAETARPSQLLRRFGLTPPPVSTRLTPLSLTGSAEGQIEGFELDVELQSRAATLRVKGTAGWAEGRPSYRLELTGQHPDHLELLARLGARLAAPPDEAGRPIDLQATVEATAGGDIEIKGSARIGPMSLIGGIGWRTGPARPRLTVQLSAGDPRVDLLQAVAGLAGWRLDPGLAASFAPGAWPATPLRLGWLQRVDMALDLSAKGGFAGAGLELTASVEGGRLVVDRLAAAPFGGRLSLSGSLATSRPLPFLTMEVELEDVAVDQLAQWLGLGTPIAGAGDVALDATSAGASVSDLVRGLIGELRLTVAQGQANGLGRPYGGRADGRRPDGGRSDGRGPTAGVGGPADIDPAPLALSGLDATIAVRKGIAQVENVALELDDAPARVDGLIDFLAWATDLELRWQAPDGAPLALQLIGPLDRPQRRWLRPTANSRAPAPPR